jgi:orotidine-5'-phosphate decarboxylase
MKGPRLIIALDEPDSDRIKLLLSQLSPNECRIKIGHGLFTALGPDIVKYVISLGFDVFLDLKFHDIPQTVAKACESAAKLGVWMLNVHVASGVDALSAAKEVLMASAKPPLLLGVTALTSLGAQDRLDLRWAADDIQEIVLAYAGLAKRFGLDGVVCSPQELRMLRKAYGSEFILLSPGIRPKLYGKDDQKRTMTAEEAMLAGADYLVVGRPITCSDNPRQVVTDLMQVL